MDVNSDDTNTYYSINIVIFLFSLFVIGLLTGVSWLLAFANDEQGPSLIGSIGHYMFLLFRFPTHNIIWMNPELIGAWFFPGLAINVVLYSILTTIVVARIRTRREKSEQTS